MHRITQLDWIKYFPFAKPRADQAEFISFALNAFLRDGKRFVIGELPTGIGKSAIAVTIARYLAENDPIPDEAEYTSGAYVLTTQKILQEQYLDDFSHLDMRSIKSSTNYQCKFYTEQSCAESRRVLDKMEHFLIGTPFHAQCRGSCTYAEAKGEFLRAQMGVTNFSYFLAETMYGGALTARQLMVIDEAHNVESEVAKFVALRIEPGSDNEFISVKLPPLRDQAEAYEWVKSTYAPELKKKLDSTSKRIARQIEKNGSKRPTKAFIKLMKENEQLDKHLCKVNRFIESYNTHDWILNRDEKSIEFKPVDVSRHTEWNLFKHAPRCLILSATILDHEFYCETLGIPLNVVSFMACDSPFPAEKRPIHYVPVGKMNVAEIDRTIPRVVEAVKAILETHKNDKGIIHCVSYKVLKTLQDSIKDRRLLFQTSGDVREKILWEHLRSPEPTVLVSPSMTEGVDLSDDLSRFQIFCKVPFPYMGDEYCQRKIKRTPDWYPYVTARTIIQAVGRSIRNESDWATTYILDGSFEYFYKKNQKFFPEYFKRSVHM